jgi:allantoicase
MSDFTRLVDLASERLGGAAVAANDEFFAPASSLVRPEKPVFREGEYTDRGKWMDGWETRRRRAPGHDWCVVRLGLPGVVRGFVVDTTHFKGNAPEACSIEACEAPSELAADAVEAAPWREVLPRSPLSPDRPNPFEASSAARVTHVRLNIHPDGGVARLRVHGEPTPDWERIARTSAEADLAAVENGAVAVSASDEFFGAALHLIWPGPPLGMHDGWETRRRRGPGHDWAILRLGRRGAIRRVELDTSYFKGNAPGWASIDVCDAPAAAVEAGSATWRELLPKTALRPDTLHRFEAELSDAGRATHARLNIFPDGGVGRLRLFSPVAEWK